MKIEMSVEVNVLETYEGRISVEAPDDATYSDIREAMKSKLEDLRHDPDEELSTMAEFRWARGMVSDASPVPDCDRYGHILGISEQIGDDETNPYR